MTAALETPRPALVAPPARPRLYVVPPCPAVSPAAAVSGVAGTVKVALDAVAALVLIVVFAPLMLVLAGAVRVDGGPAFFRQTRVGLDGREFTMLKFRSMVVDAETHLARLHAVNDGAGPLFKLRTDPRITRVGAVLRRYSLDELPQLFNVLAGSMSLVGPRPSLPREVATYDATVRRRLAVRPGMTGLWQVSGRSDLCWAESVRLDLRYVDEWNPALDLRILAGTARAVINGGGAY